MKYKPSLIAETCTYLLTGNKGIYSVQELSGICKNIKLALKRAETSNLNAFKDAASTLLPLIISECHHDAKQPVLSPLKYHEPWHIGEFEILDFLGKGSYGKVNKIKRKACGTHYAVKKTEFDDSSILEIGILNVLKNEKHIITLCGFNQQNEILEIILPAYDSDLEKLQYKNYPMLFKQILEAVYECHQYDILHRDIKDNNFLYKDGNVVLIDFGLSVPFQSIRKPSDTTVANTLHYRPPECLLGIHVTYGFEIDIWAVGCLFYYLLLGKYIVDTNVSDSEYYFLDSIFEVLGTPTKDDWPTIPEEEIQQLTIHKGNIPALKILLEPYSDLVLDCLQLNPQKRPSAKQLLQKYF